MTEGAFKMEVGRAGVYDSPMAQVCCSAIASLFLDPGLLCPEVRLPLRWWQERTGGTAGPTGEGTAAGEDAEKNWV